MKLIRLVVIMAMIGGAGVAASTLPHGSEMEQIGGDPGGNEIAQAAIHDHIGTSTTTAAAPCELVDSTEMCD